MVKTLYIISSFNIRRNEAFFKAGAKGFFLSDNYAQFMRLKKELPPGALNGLGRIFDEELLRHREGFIELLNGINTANDSFAWWAGHFASKSTTSVSFVRLAVYFFCALRLMDESAGPIAFMVESPALARLIDEAAQNKGWLVRSSFFPAWLWRAGIRGMGVLVRTRQIAGFTLKCLRRKVHAAWSGCGVKIVDDGRKKIFLRTWVTEGSFDQEGKVVERNFGGLAQWFKAQGYAVYHCPMFFNIKRSMTLAYQSVFKSWEGACLIPEHYLKWSDYLKVISEALQAASLRKQRIDLRGSDCWPLVNETLITQGIDSNLCVLNLDVRMLERLSERGVLFERLIYPFEGLPPENQFVLAFRRHYPGAPVVAFQHAAFFFNQLAYHLAEGERTRRSLPDVMVCSGKRYVELFKAGGFPGDVVREGPNLRYVNAYGGSLRAARLAGVLPAVLAPLSHSHAMAADVFMKLAQAFNGTDVKVYIRTHPLLSKGMLQQLIDASGLMNYAFADSLTMQDWLSRAGAMVTTGGSITTVEAVVAGVPVIRVAPDAVIHFDALHEPEYPLPCAYSGEEIRMQFSRIGLLLKDDPSLFTRFGEAVERKYFSQPTETLMRAFDAKAR